MKFLRVQRRKFGEWPSAVQEQLLDATMGDRGLMQRTAGGNPETLTQAIFLRNDEGHKIVASGSLMKRDGYIRAYTVPEHRQKGLAGRLLRYLIRKNGKTHKLRGWVGRADAHGLYKKAIAKEQVEADLS